MILDPLMSSKDTSWCTPLDVLNPLRTVARIALDPCSNDDSIVRPARAIALPEDGLAAEWTCAANELIFVNPPYGRQIGPWVDKCAAVGRVDTVVALLPARTDTRWWQDNVRSAAATCFWRGRLKFSGAKDCAPFPSALVLWTWRKVTIEHAFRVAFEPLGLVM